MLAELFILRLEAMLRSNSAITGASDTRFVAFKRPAESPKPSPAKIGDAPGSR